MQLLDEYIEKLYVRQNLVAGVEQQNLISKNYYEMLEAVAVCLNNNKDKTITELKEILFLQSSLLENVKDVVLNKQLCYDNYKETLVIGNRQEVTLDKNNNIVPTYKEMILDTIFDLVSIAKIFTNISILKLVQLRLINLDNYVVKYAPQFKYLSNVTIFDLLAFQKPLMTDQRIDNVSDYLEAENIFFNFKVNENFNPLANSYDVKARIMDQKKSNLSRHAGLFASNTYMIKFAKGILI